jgi:prolyl-tRNA synthetase
MTHSDDDGLIVPPKLAPAHIVLLPIVHKEKDRAAILSYTDELAAALRARYYHHRPLRVEVDSRDIGGTRGWEWIKKGVPMRVEIGPRDMANNAVFVGRRDKAHKDKVSLDRQAFIEQATRMLDEIQSNIFNRAVQFRKEHTRNIDDRKDFDAFFTPRDQDSPEIHGGFAMSHWCGSGECEASIKEELTVTIRCIPFDGEPEQGRCICCGQPSQKRVVFAKAY